LTLHDNINIAGCVSPYESTT